MTNNGTNSDYLFVHVYLDNNYNNIAISYTEFKTCD